MLEGGEGNGKLSQSMSVESLEEDEWQEETSAEIRRIAAKMKADAFSTELAVESRYAAEVRSLVFGHPAEAALGIGHFLKIAPDLMRSGMNEGIAKIEAEIAAHGTAEDKECLHYCLHEAAGSSDREFQNGRRDVGRNGEKFDHFVKHELSQKSGLEPAHVLALRLYSTAIYKSINGPLRDTTRQGAHPLAVTVAFVDEAVQAAVVGARERTSTISEQILWRGMRNAAVPEDFMQQGGTELAPMSTTADLAVAMEYSASKNPCCCASPTSFMDRGADISFVCLPSRRRCSTAAHASRPLATWATIGDATVKVIGEAACERDGWYDDCLYMSIRATTTKAGSNPHRRHPGRGCCSTATSTSACCRKSWSRSRCCFFRYFFERYEVAEKGMSRRPTPWPCARHADRIAKVRSCPTP